MIEYQILQGLVNDEEYTRQVMPFVKEDYFTQPDQKLVFKIIGQYFEKYNALPAPEALLIEINQVGGFDEKTIKSAVDIVESFEGKEVDEWLIDQTETFCQDKAIYNAIMSGINIIEKDPDGKGQLPGLLQEALQVSFDNSVGHDFEEDADARHDFYNRVESKLPVDLEMLKKITKDGIPTKTLNIIMAGTGVGKSLFMCHMACANMLEGKNVLYITMEMAEERIAERLDANLLDVTMEELGILPKSSYQKKMKRLMDTCTGKIVIKEYPTASANANHFRHLLQELRTKKNFKPDVIYIDYLNICASFRIRGGANAGSYAIVKAIAEELRGLAVEFNVPIISATQTNRSGFSCSDIGLEDTSESFGLPATADFMLAISQTEELEQLNQYMVKQLKNRYADPNFHKRFVVGVDKSKMRLFDVEQSAQKQIVDDTPLFDRSQDKPNKDLKSLFDDFK